MKIKIILIYFLLIFPVMSDEKYLYFDDQNIFYYSKNSKLNFQNSNFSKLRNFYKLVLSKFDATLFYEEKENINNKEKININNKFKFEKNFQYNLKLNSKDFEKKNSLFFFKNNILIDEFRFPNFRIDDENIIINKKKILNKRNVLTRFQNFFNSDVMLYKNYNDISFKAKLKDINILFEDFEKNLIIIESNQNITEFFIKFESKSLKHYGYFNKKIYQDENRQYFSAVEDTVNKSKHLNIVKDLKFKSGEEFYITEIQIVFDKTINDNKFFSFFSLSNIIENNKENLDFLISNNKQNFIFNINKYLKKKLNHNDLDDLTMISEIDTILYYEKTTNKIKEIKINNFNLKNLKKFLKKNNGFIFAELTNLRDLSKFYFLIYSLFPFIFFVILSFVIKLKIKVSKKILFISKTLMKVFFIIFIISFLLAIYTELNHFGTYAYYAFILFSISYLIVKKHYQLIELNDVK